MQRAEFLIVNDIGDISDRQGIHITGQYQLWILFLMNTPQSCWASSYLLGHLFSHN